MMIDELAWVLGPVGLGWVRARSTVTMGSSAEGNAINKTVTWHPLRLLQHYTQHRPDTVEAPSRRPIATCLTYLPAHRTLGVSETCCLLTLLIASAVVDGWIPLT